MADYKRINPLKVFENTYGSISYAGVFKSIAVSSNNLVVTAVAGKRVRLMGLYSQSNNAAQGVLQFIDGSGGTLLYSYYQPTTAQEPLLLPISETGYLETSTGVGLYANALTQAVIFNAFYIIYTPE